MCQFLQMICLKVVYFVGYVDTNFTQDGNYNKLMYNSETFSIWQIIILLMITLASNTSCDVTHEW